MVLLGPRPPSGPIGTDSGDGVPNLGSVVAATVMAAGAAMLGMVLLGRVVLPRCVGALRMVRRRGLRARSLAGSVRRLGAVRRLRVV